ncbi:deleted in malignant brain tumors 1 protein-like [Lytechinus variegatus]|uniref:deleted in malignant brain tumors 1 protein-like n=1 Tax=Lytechinus variegatus TaxID=7654 RepID=UPI001BB1AA41|nr:deleted in malignant brain tumors 1 protein-like [Lytechinus variegatus]
MPRSKRSKSCGHSGRETAKEDDIQTRVEEVQEETIETEEKFNDEQSQASIRLVDGTTDYNGRVEISYFGEWGTVCDDLWDDTDATVVCRILGLGTNGIAYQNAYFGQGTGNIILDNVQCVGTETDLVSCPSNGLLNHNCGHSEDAGVQCFNATSESIRLVGGSSDTEGRVEVYYNGEWGTVCDDLWDDTDAAVVCQILGLGDSGTARTNAAFGQGSGSIILDNVQCDGTETDLFACPSNGPNNHNCGHGEDAGVECTSTTTSSPAETIRLVGGSSDSEGRVEVYYGGEWGTVCDDLWDDTDAAVVCQILGLGDSGTAQANAAFGQGSGSIILDNVQCDGTETDLFACPSNGPNNHNCGHSEDAGVECSSTTTSSPTESIRLVDGASDSEGRVEVYYGGEWGTVCDDLWDDTDAAVVCQILGLGDSGTARSNAAFGQGSGSIILDNVQCDGTETDLFACPSNGPNNHNCGHSEDAGVECTSTTTSSPTESIRLVDGASDSEGRVEVYYGGEWGTVCDDLWDDTDAAVVCQILGLGDSGTARSNAAFGQGSGSIILDNVQCDGTETDLFACPSNGPNNHNCGHSEDAGVECTSTTTSSPTESIRLVDGASDSEGRVEVYYGGEWGTVCDDLWDDTDAAVVCQILGLGDSGTARTNAAFGQGSGSIILDNVQCDGTETDLFACPSNGPNNHNCGHSEDAGVECTSTTTSSPTESIRLVGGSSDTEGRVEVYYGGEWGTVCDDLWDDTDAAVVCQILGLGDSGTARTNAAFGQGSGSIILDNVQCDGTESDLFACPSNGPNNHNCGHSEDAGVECSSTTTSSPTESIRLVDGASDSEGRVEVYYGGEWGTVCDDLWDDTDAAVVCQILGLGDSGTARSNAAFGQGSGSIILDNVQCDGTETDLFACPSNGPNNHNCGHSEDAGVECTSTTTSSPTESIRLVGGSSDTEGRVEVYYGGEWGTVCDDLWDDTDAAVVCQILGLGDSGTARTNAAFGQGSGSIILDNVQCDGTETDLFACPSNGPNNHNCGHSEDAGVECSSTTTSSPTESIRLVDGASDSEGRVEVYYGGEWGTVCDDLWDDTDATVVCQILGLGDSGTARSNAAFGQGSGSIILDNVQCEGTETDLFACPSNGPNNHNCGHSEDAGVVCSSTTTSSPTELIRLVGGSSDSEGRVEVYYNGEWGTVCDDYWDGTDATVVCQILGLGDSGTAQTNAAFGQGSGSIILDDVHCTGTELSIFDCPSNGPYNHNCGHSEDAGVVCSSTTTYPPTESIRLVGGLSDTEGRVEVYYGGEWGTVCDDLWDDTDATVVCQILGLGDSGIARSNAAFGQGSGSIILDNVQCDGTETDLFACPSNGPNNHNCVHSEDAGVECTSTTTPAPTESIRLVNGASNSEGRVEVYYGGEWGTVCDDLWDDTDATVVCQILGLGDSGIALSYAAFGEGSGSIILDNVECDGTETDLFACPSNGPNNHNCGHGEDAGVQCTSATTSSPTESIRLVDGTSDSEGRVEVYYGGGWGTVCDDLWDDTDATVVCQILGLGDSGIARSNAAFGEGSGSIILDNVQCEGTETDLFACPSNGPNNHNCVHGEDAGAQCTSATTSASTESIRLVNGASDSEGRVEVYYGGEWGTVCDDFWDDTDATVVCQILGLGDTGIALSYAAFGEGSGSIILDNVQCEGTETDLFACPNNGPNIHNCVHNEDAGVSCSNTLELIRLVDGSSDSEGRVEVYYNGEWGTVCDDSWDDTDATVVCQVLGLGDSGTARGNAAFGEGSGNIILDNVQCDGTEANLFSCPNNGPNIHNCGHYEDAGVVCSSTTTSSPTESIRLVGGSSDTEGRVEVYYNGEWGTVCDDLWGSTDATVVCQILGLGDSGIPVSFAAFGEGSGSIILDNVECVGTETDLFACPSNGPNNHNCGHSEDAGVQCTTATTPSPTESIRLVGGSSDTEGRVEVYYGGEWGTVCDDMWDDTDATVVCQILGLGDSGTALSFAAFGGGSGSIILDNVQCYGTETDLFACPNSGPNIHNCVHAEDAGVSCSNTPSVIRLVDGSSDTEGRVEVYYNGEWGTVCDDSWDDTDATVVCQILGLGDSGTAQSNAAFGEGSGSIILDNVECDGTETDLVACPSNGPYNHNCGHDEDAGVLCSSNTGSIRLVGGLSETEGRVEVQYNGEWGTVCDDFWDDTDATVVCQILDLGDIGTAYSSAHFGEGSGSIILNEVQCNGTEADLFACPHSGPNIYNCGHFEDAGVSCSNTPSGSIRLVDGLSETEGRVEVYYGGEWGTVCDDLWDDTDATVVCQILGLGDSGTARGNAAFGEGSGSIILDDVECDGTETNLFACHSNGPYNHNCVHGEDAGVECTSTTTSSSIGLIRLVGGSSDTEGRVEVNYGGEWGTVCDDLWDDTDATVVCQILGLGDSGTAYSGAYFGEGSGNIILDNVECDGGETDLFACPNNGPNIHNCGHYEDAGVSCSNAPSGSIRLVDGSSETEGRVEVQYNGEWGTVCDDYWDDTDATVVCQFLGLGYIGTAYSGAHFGEGSGSIILDDVQCDGTESSIFDCPNNGEFNHNCGHYEDAGVSCTIAPSGSIRLVDGSSETEGRVEVQYNGEWGTVCDDYWDDTDATVVCQFLGLGDIGTAYSGAHFGEGSGSIILDDVQCDGTESNIFDCPNNGEFNHNCGHYEDAGVSCSNAPSGSIRLVDGLSETEGRVEVYYGGEWGTVCDDLWDETDATVVCQILGLGDSGIALSYAAFGEGSGSIILDNVECDGTETDLFACPSNGPNNHNCGHGEDAGVQCTSATTSSPTESIRLVDGSSYFEGRVEVYYNGEWGTVCDDSWDNTDATVVCRILGLGDVGMVAYFGEGSGSIILDDVQCEGTETNLFDCPNNGPNIHNCGHYEDVGVSCSNTPSGSIRLVGGSSDTEGRVEVRYNEEWGTVCDDYWDDTDATVVCQFLGLGDNGTAYSSAYFGEGSGSIILDDVQCDGTESNIFDCPNNGEFNHNCGHYEDAGVSCSNTPSGSIRLVGGASDTEGRVEVYYNGEWGTVCDDFWDDTDATVVCQILGLGDSGTAQSNAAFGEGSGSIILDNVQCDGTETDLFACPSNGPNNHNCGHYEDAGVSCSNTPFGSIRLVDGSSETEGRVEVQYNGEWGTVCDDYWDDTDATVVCQFLGLGNVGTVAYFGEGSGSIILDDVECDGTEINLFDCPHNGVFNHNCGHYEDAGVSCSNTPSGSVRLVGGTSDTEGRVEVYYGGEWGTVCDDLWDDTDATVVCQILGLGDSGVARSYAAFGEGSGSIILDNVECEGTETDLFACPNNGPNVHNCVHAEDAGVSCSNAPSGSVRLVGGSLNTEGRVEVQYNGEWGTVCDDYWDDTDATVVCQILGLGDSGTAYSNAHFGEGSGSIILDDVECDGTETNILDCPNNGAFDHNCVHGEDAGVSCSPVAPGLLLSQDSIRLVGGSSFNEGRVEVRYQGEWGTVCDDLWDEHAARVVCQALGLGDVAIPFGNAMFGEGTGKIILDNVQCRGTEADLFECPGNHPLVHDCNHFEDAGVHCYISDD